MAEIAALDPATEEHRLRHLLQRALRTEARPAIDLALRRLDAHYEATQALDKRVAILIQLAHLHPNDEAIRTDLASVYVALGHVGDAARLEGTRERGRAEIVRIRLQQKAVEMPQVVEERIPDAETAPTEPPTTPPPPAVVVDPSEELEALELPPATGPDPSELELDEPAPGAAVVFDPSEVDLDDPDMQDTLPPMATVIPPLPAPPAAIGDADTDVELVPRSLPIPNDPTAHVDPKVLDLLRRLSS